VARFTELPPLTKDSIRAHFDQLKSDDLASRRWVLNCSGGSTGQPITLVQDTAFQQWSVATQQFFLHRMLGFEESFPPTVELWGSEKDTYGDTESLKVRLRNWWLQWTFLNSYRMSELDMQRYVAIINRKQPLLIRAYAGSIYELARFIKSRGLPIHRPRVIQSAAETLFPFMRELITAVFGCPVRDFYGSREVGPLAAECARGKMHVFSFNNLVEVVDEQNRAVAPGQEGRVLVTVLHNYAMPLLRYEIGDLAIVGHPCDCGLHLPTLERVSGRVTDQFVTPTGTLIDGRFFTSLFFYKEWVREFQIVQTDQNALDIYYAPRVPPPAADVAEIEAKIRYIMGADCQIRWREVATVPLTPQGKRLYTRSLVRAGQLTGHERTC
jgi:phenylacetate-CoA ligase